MITTDQPREPIWPPRRRESLTEVMDRITKDIFRKVRKEQAELIRKIKREAKKKESRP